MTCSHCCDADKFFDAKSARKELQKYNKKGPWGSTKKIIEGLRKVETEGKTLLDIGGGIGALQWFFLKHGGKSTMSVDASSGYLEIASQYATGKNWKDKTHFIHGDFNDNLEQIEKSDFVTLDKVICCYPDFKLILKNAIDKSDKYLALSYPISNWISRALNRMSRLYFLFKKSSFRSYVHPNQEIRDLIQKNEMKLINSSRSFPWVIEIYQRKSVF